jgi:hypothetical protein
VLIKKPTTSRLTASCGSVMVKPLEVILTNTSRARMPVFWQYLLAPTQNRSLVCPDINARGDGMHPPLGYAWAHRGSVGRIRYPNGRPDMDRVIASRLMHLRSAAALFHHGSRGCSHPVLMQELKFAHCTGVSVDI